jgi:uncharacterized protein (TIGR02646 family)
MIKLSFQPRPSQLTDEKVAKLTLDFKADTKKTVWNTPYIKAALLQMSHGKCCFCECKIAEESKYMEVEHFYPKSLYPDDVLNWLNLLPCCKRCNMYKDNFDTKKQPIVHPVLDTPNAHFYFKDYRIVEKTQQGNLTIDVLQLNDFQRVMKPRLSIGSKLLENLHDLLDEINSGVDKTSKFKRKFYDLLFQGNDTEEYAALCATLILESEDYKKIKTIFQKNAWWTSELEVLEAVLQKNALLKT